jgi:hypothetical protein
VILNLGQNKIDCQQGTRGLLGKDCGYVADVIGFVADRIGSQRPDGETDQGHGDRNTDKGASDDGSEDEGTIGNGSAEQRLRPKKVQLRPKTANPSERS